MSSNQVLNVAYNWDDPDSEGHYFQIFILEDLNLKERYTAQLSKPINL